MDLDGERIMQCHIGFHSNRRAQRWPSSLVRCIVGQFICWTPGLFVLSELCRRAPQIGGLSLRQYFSAPRFDSRKVTAVLRLWAYLMDKRDYPSFYDTVIGCQTTPVPMPRRPLVATSRSRRPRLMRSRAGLMCSSPIVRRENPRRTP